MAMKKTFEIMTNLMRHEKSGFCPEKTAAVLTPINNGINQLAHPGFDLSSNPNWAKKIRKHFENFLIELKSPKKAQQNQRAA